MNKLKKIGLTALAGSMVATAATAADVSVGMGWSLSYTSADSDENGGTASWTIGDSITFTTTGELDNGWTATAYLEVDETGGDGIDDEKLTLDMGDMGTLGFGSNAGHGFGRDAVKNCLTGFLINPRDSKVLAEKILFLLVNKSLLKKMGAEARKLAEREFSSNKVVKEHLKIYKDLLK